MSNIQHIARTGSLIADTLSWPPGSSICNDNESPPRGTVRVRRGGKAKIKPVNLIGRAEFFSGGTSNSECCPSDARGGRLLALATRQADFSANTAGRFFDFLAAFHRLAHTGTLATKQQMATRVMCKGLNSDMATWYKIC